MNIAIIGAGHVGSAVGTAWSKAGHHVVFGVPADKQPSGRESSASIPSLEAGKAISVVSAVLLAIPWQAVPAFLQEYAQNLKGKLLIDATNPLQADFSDMEDGYTISGAERVAEWAQNKSVFKAFNQTGSENMEAPQAYAALPGAPRPVMFYCGDDDALRPHVKQLVEDAGFEAVDAGPLRSARLVEPYGMLWIRLAHAQQPGRRFAFTLARLPNS